MSHGLYWDTTQSKYYFKPLGSHPVLEEMLIVMTPRRPHMLGLARGCETPNGWGGSTWTDYQLEASMCPSCGMSNLMLYNTPPSSSNSVFLALPLAQYVFWKKITHEDTCTYSYSSRTPFVLLCWDFFLLLPQQRRCRCLQSQMANTCQTIMFAPTCSQSEEHALLGHSFVRRDCVDEKRISGAFMTSPVYMETGAPSLCPSCFWSGTREWEMLECVQGFLWLFTAFKPSMATGETNARTGCGEQE